MISRYRSRIRSPCNIMAPRDRTISYTNARLMQTMQNSDNYLQENHLKGPGIRPVGDRVPLNLPTHALFDLYFAHSANSLFKPMTTAAGIADWRIEFLGWPALQCHAHARIVSVNRRADRKVRFASVYGVRPKIHVSRP